MEIQFADKRLRELCENQAIAVKKLGAACARKLRNRLADLASANTVSELIAGRPHPLERDRAGQFAVDLAGGCRLVFSPATIPTPRNDALSFDWSRVTIICIEYIGDYHD